MSAHLGNNYLPLVERFYRSSRSGLFDLLNVLVLEPTSTDRGVLDAVRFLRGQRAKTGEFIAGRVNGREVDLGFASQEWRKLIVDWRRPGKLVRRHFET